MRILALLTILALAATPVLAAATDWQEVAPDTRVRVISSDVRDADGTTLAGLEIDMPATTKTYWRIPGETGIPTTLDLAASRGVTGHDILWPYPLIDTQAGYVDFVYYGPTVLPVRLTLSGDAAVLDVSVLMGICSDICLPAQAKFTLPLDFARPDTGQGLRLQQALTNVPLPAEDDDAVGAVTLLGETLSVALGSAEIDPASIIVAGADDGLLFGAPKKSPDSGLIELPLLGGSGENGLVGQSVQITFMTPMGPYEVTRQVQSAESTAGGE